MYKSDDGLRCFIVLLSGRALIIGAGAADDTIMAPGIDLRDLNSIDVTDTNNIIKQPDTGTTQTRTEFASDFLDPSASGQVQRPISSLPSSSDNPVFSADSLNNEKESSSGISSRIAIYKDGSWYIDMNGDGVWNTGDRNAGFGAPSWLPVVGDWNGDGISEIGTYRNGAWYLDYDNSGSWNSADKNYGFGAAGWTPVIWDWNADGFDEVGVYNNGAWYLDRDGDGNFDNGESCSFGSEGWTPVVGKWSSDGKTKIGISKNGVYYIDYNGDGSYGAGDQMFSLGTTGSNPLTGDWNNNAQNEVGTRTSNVWKLDYDGSYTWNTGDITYVFGSAGWIPVIGDWNADGKDKIGIYLNGAWYLDANGNGVWDAGADKNYAFGTTGWTPVIGKWALPPQTQTEYKVYAEVGECSLVHSAQDFWAKINNAHREYVAWKDSSGRGLLVKPNCNDPNPCTGDTCPRASHWTSLITADQWIGQADFVYYSGHGGPGDPPPPQAGPGYIIITDDGDNTAAANNMRLNSTGKIKWVVFDSCDTLYNVDDSFEQWVPSFDNGLHMLLGWATSVVPSVENDEYRGGVFALLMKGEYNNDETHYSMFEAWHKAGQITYLSFPHYSSYDVWNAVMYPSDINGENGCKNDHLPGWDTFCTNPSEWGYIAWYPQLVFAQASSRSSSSASINSRSMNLQEGTYSLAASVPVTSNKSITYEAVNSGYTKEQVSSLAKSLGMSGDIRETNEAFYPSDKDAEQFLFVVEKKSSMITFRKNDIGSSTIQSDAQIISAANTFLQKNNLIPPGKLEPRAVHNTAVIYSRSGQRVGERKINVVVYPQIINELPVFNAQFNVEVGSDGNIIGLFKNWRDYKPAEKITLKSPEEAFGELKTHQPKSKTIIPKKVKVTGVSLGYFMHSSSDGEEEYLLPAYIFEGDNLRGDSIEPFESVVIDAKKEEVRENITSSTPTSIQETEFTDNATQNVTLIVTSSVIETQNITSSDIFSTIYPALNQNVDVNDNLTDTASSLNLSGIPVFNSTTLLNETMNNESISGKVT